MYSAHTHLSNSHRCGYPCPDKFNPSDHYVHVLAIIPGDEESCRERVRAITQEFQDSDEGREIKAVVEHEKTHRKKTPNLLSEVEQKKPSPYRASWMEQFWWVKLPLFFSMTKK